MVGEVEESTDGIFKRVGLKKVIIVYRTEVSSPALTPAPDRGVSQVQGYAPRHRPPASTVDNLLLLS